MTSPAVSAMFLRGAARRQGIKLGGAQLDRVKLLIGAVLWQGITDRAAARVPANTGGESRSDLLARKAFDEVIAEAHPGGGGPAMSYARLPHAHNGGALAFDAMHGQLRDRAFQAAAARNQETRTSTEELYVVWLKWLGVWDTEWMQAEDAATAGWKERLRKHVESAPTRPLPAVEASSRAPRPRASKAAPLPASTDAERLIAALADERGSVLEGKVGQKGPGRWKAYYETLLRVIRQLGSDAAVVEREIARGEIEVLSEAAGYGSYRGVGGRRDAQIVEFVVHSGLRLGTGASPTRVVTIAPQGFDELWMLEVDTHERVTPGDDSDLDAFLAAMRSAWRDKAGHAHEVKMSVPAVRYFLRALDNLIGEGGILVGNAKDKSVDEDSRKTAKQAKTDLTAARQGLIGWLASVGG